MPLSLADLRGDLANLNPEHQLLLAVNGTFVPVVGISAAEGSPYIVICGKGKTAKGKRFEVGEEAILSHLAGCGKSDDLIAQVLGRTLDSVARRRKEKGL